jgi:uncharacterized protein YjbJ (UPF0337 family)
MDRDRTAGSAKEIKGPVKETIGKATGDAKLQADGRADKVEGTVRGEPVGRFVPRLARMADFVLVGDIVKPLIARDLDTLVSEAFSHAFSRDLGFRRNQ